MIARTSGPAPRVAIIQMDGSAPRGAPHLGSNARWLTHALHAANDAVKVSVVHAFDGEPLPKSLLNLTAEGPVGVIGTGGGGYVTDRAPWLMKVGEDLARVSERYPVLGICLSHQLLAQTLGGEVDFLEGGEAGTRQVSVRHPDDFFSGIPEKFALQETHHQRVTRLPPGAVLLASNDAGIQSYGVGRNIRGIQGHPEMTSEILRAYTHQPVRVTPDAPRLIENWLTHFVSEPAV